MIDVLDNDDDVEGDVLSVYGYTHGENGTVAQEGDSLRYTPDVNFNGTDSFTYDIGDGKGGIRLCMKNKGHPADDEISDLVLFKKKEDVFKIVESFHQSQARFKQACLWIPWLVLP